ncbi:MAG: hypothetical protein ACTHLA_09810 [Asticcacaulis sp.]|uniref:hypothetical protein n=1 Tax=Asticcacaulis sp. TaxID=1872648 RepID=UPI003F7BEC20
MPVSSHIAASEAAATGPVDAHAAARLIAEANARHDLQARFGASDAPDAKTLAFWEHVRDAVQRFFDTLGHLLAPIGPAMPYILWGLLILVVALILSPVVRLFLTSRFERFFARHTLRADAEWRPSASAVAALLAEIDALAARGAYDEAVHLLLVRSVADINAFRPDLVRKHFSARDILSHPLLPDNARPTFAEIVRWVEQSFFAGVRVGKAGFDACRAAYVRFAAAEGLAPQGSA